MKLVKWIVAAALMAAAFSAPAATYYVRTDGGTSTQCTGLANAAYPGSGTNQACALSHLGWAIGMKNGNAAKIAGGDTVIVGNGSYMFGWGSSADQTGCSGAAGYDCLVRAVPSGPSPAAKTRILGEGHATGCKVKPEFWGQERLDYVLNLDNSSNVEIGCLEITDHSSCLVQHIDPTFRCVRDTAPYGPYADNGIEASDSSNVWLHDLNIHGLGSDGVRAGRLTDWTIERVRIAANGLAGWNGDIGTNESSNSGSIIFRNVEVAWNGCTEAYPSGEIIGCFGQVDGGYGDGLGTSYSGGNWLLEDVYIHHNTSDGLDLLYLNDTATSTLRRVRAYANAGNQVKTSGIVLIENSYIVGYCQSFFQRFPHDDSQAPEYVDGYAMGPGESCRAQGNSLSIDVPALTGVTATIRYSTISGTGDCLLLLGTEVTQPTSAAIINVENSVWAGGIDWAEDRGGTPGAVACLEYHHPSYNPTINWRNNYVTNVKYGDCPGDSTCTPLNVRDGNQATFDGRPTATSPMVNDGDTTYPYPAMDIRGVPRDSTPTAGAFEYVP